MGDYFKTLMKLERRCDRCKDKFRCYTTNTSNRPTQLKGINFEVARCCIRCKHGHFKTGKESEGVKRHDPLPKIVTYIRVGECLKHGVAIHQFSYCGDFLFKVNDNLKEDILYHLECELVHKTHNYKFPRYCIVDNKNIGEELEKIRQKEIQVGMESYERGWDIGSGTAEWGRARYNELESK